MIDLIAGLVDALVFIAAYLAIPRPESFLLAQQLLAPLGFIADLAAFAVAVALAGRMKALLTPISKAKWWQALTVLALACVATAIRAYAYAPSLIKIQLHEAANIGAPAPPQVSEELAGFIATVSAVSAAVGIIIAVAVNALIAFIAAKLLGAEQLGFLEAFKAYSLGQLGGIVGGLASLATYTPTAGLFTFFATSRTVGTPILIALITGYALGVAEEGRERRYAASILLPLVVMGILGLVSYAWTMNALAALHAKPL